MEWRAVLTDKQIDQVIELAASIAGRWYFGDDPESGWGDDRSWCPYFRRGLPGADPNGTCSFGCWDEPSCLTSGGGDVSDLYAILAPTGYFDVGEPEEET